jgi:molybdopterin molybdotransferase
VLSLDEARSLVIEEVTRVRGDHAEPTRIERVPLGEALGRVLAEAARADRDQPPFVRSTRDGFAVQSADVAQANATAPVRLRVLGELPAGRSWDGAVGGGEAVEIMTGAPLPAGADAVVMVEHTRRGPGAPPSAGPDLRDVLVERSVSAGENQIPRGSELQAGAVALAAGRRLDAAALGLLASLGVARPAVHRRPVVAILTTGDEIVPIDATPLPAQIRDSNGHALAAQVISAGGSPLPMGNAPDDPARLEERLVAAFEAGDLVLVTGGVSMGKHDHVEPVLARFRAEIRFDAVAIRPGKPLVFGTAPGARLPSGSPAQPLAKPFFGLPGNPLSTFVTFELFVRPALELLAGLVPSPRPRSFSARLAAPYRQRAVPLTVFLPARIVHGSDGPTVAVLPSQGSGDLVALATADALLILPPDTAELPTGAPVQVIPKTLLG